jgi:hypothetical protein
VGGRGMGRGGPGPRGGRGGVSLNSTL